MTETTAEQAIVVGIDASQASLGAARWAGRVESRRNATLLLFHACVFERGESSARGDSEMLLEYGYRGRPSGACGTGGRAGDTD
jgi:hypothetical protein